MNKPDENAPIFYDLSSIHDNIDIETDIKLKTNRSIRFMGEQTARTVGPMSTRTRPFKKYRYKVTWQGLKEIKNKYKVCNFTELLKYNCLSKEQQSYYD